MRDNLSKVSWSCFKGQGQGVCGTPGTGAMFLGWLQGILVGHKTLQSLWKCLAVERGVCWDANITFYVECFIFAYSNLSRTHGLKAGFKRDFAVEISLMFLENSHLPEGLFWVEVLDSEGQLAKQSSSVGASCPPELCWFLLVLSGLLSTEGVVGCLVSLQTVNFGCF